jgi:hypothetical protein
VEERQNRQPIPELEELPLELELELDEELLLE